MCRSVAQMREVDMQEEEEVEVVPRALCTAKFLMVRLLGAEKHACEACSHALHGFYSNMH